MGRVLPYVRAPRGAPIPRSAVPAFGALLLWLGAAGAASAQVHIGCYDSQLGPWVPAPMFDEPLRRHALAPDLTADSVYYAFPPRLELSLEAAGPGSPGLRRMSIPPEALQLPHPHLGWSFADDTLRIQISTGYAGTSSKLVRVGDSWVGAVRSQSHVIGLRRYHRYVRLTPVDCASPPPVPSSVERPLPRAVELASGAEILLGEPLPPGLRTTRRASGAHRVHARPAGYLSRADTIVVTRDPEGRVGRIEMKFPAGERAEDWVQALIGLHGPWSQSIGDDFWFWRSRTTTLTLNAARGGLRLSLTDPRHQY